MLNMFKKNEDKNIELALASLSDSNKEMCLKQLAEHLQNLKEGSVYTSEQDAIAMHNTLNNIQALYSDNELSKGIHIYGNYHYQKQENGRYEIISKTN